MGYALGLDNKICSDSGTVDATSTVIGGGGGLGDREGERIPLQIFRGYEWIWWSGFTPTFWSSGTSSG